MDLSLFISAAEAALYLGCSEKYIYQLVKSHGIGQQIAGRWVFTRSELEPLREPDRSKGGRPRRGLFGGRKD